MEKKKQQQPPPDEHRCCRNNGKGWRCKNLRIGHGAAAPDDASVPKPNRCEKHYHYMKKKKKSSGELPLDEERCCHTDGKEWRCKNFRMGHAADAVSVPKTTYCEKHYKHFAEKNNKHKKKKTSGDGKDDDTSGASAKIGAKRKYVERTQGSRKQKSSTKTVVETRTSKRRKIVTEINNQPATATDDNFDSDTIVEGGSANNGRKRKYAERMSGELDPLAGTREAVAELESLELEKKEFEMENMSVDLQKKKAACTKFRGKLVEVGTRKTTSTDENEQTLADATDRWKKLLSCLQSKENEKLRNSERVESEVPGLRNDISQSCEKTANESNKIKLNAEASTGGRKDSHVYECKGKEKVLNVCDVGANKHHDTQSEFPKYSDMNISSATLHLSSQCQNVEEGKRWGILSKRSSQHGSSQDHLEMSTGPFANLVSDDGGESLSESKDFASSFHSKNSLGNPLDMMATKNSNSNKDGMKWKSEADMISSFEEDPEICLKAICALYRQEISEDEISPKGLHFDDDTLRCTTLAKFLTDNDCKSDVKKSGKELEKFDSNGVGDCKKLVRRYSDYLFDIYVNRKDPFFLPATSSSHGDQTAK